MLLDILARTFGSPVFSTGNKPVPEVAIEGVSSTETSAEDIPTKVEEIKLAEAKNEDMPERYYEDSHSSRSSEERRYHKSGKERSDVKPKRREKPILHQGGGICDDPKRFSGDDGRRYK